MERTFDRIPQFDERSRAYAIRAALAPQELKPRGYTWGLYTQLDQGSEGACVGFGWAHELAARPAVVAHITDDVGRLIYHDAQQVDEWPGEDYEGTSVLAGAKTVVARGFMTEYRWVFSLDDLVLAVGYKGPVVMGTNWYSSMWDTDDNGWFPEGVSGNVVGGHCWLVRGVSVTKNEFLCRNSWGSEWGLYGDFRLKFDEMAKLLADSGEGCVPVGRDKIGSLT